MGFAIFTAAAIAEIAGCFAFWAWWRLDKSVFFILPGLVCLAVFAWLLTLAESDAAGRAYAAYGGIYIVTSLIWLWLIEGVKPDRWDITGAILAVTGATIILYGQRV